MQYNFNTNSERQQEAQEAQVAQVALSAKQAGDPRYVQLVQALSGKMNMQPAEVEQNIVLLAMGHQL